MRLNFDLMTGYSRLPLQIFSWSGITIAAASLLFVVYLAVRRIVIGPEAAGLFTLFGIAFFLLGCVLLGLGIIGEYIGRIFEQVRGRPRYVVSEVIGEDSESSVAGNVRAAS
jgi:undecaprenyl-phosphate 4-deoxy-4-formamido-L-arabinose transferase